MKPANYLLILLGVFLLHGCDTSAPGESAEATPEAPAREFYQLKTYNFDTDEQVQMTDQYLAEAFLPGLKRLGIGPVGVFKPRPEEGDTVRKTLVLIPFSTLEAFRTHEEKLLQDQAYLTAGDAYLNAPHDQPPYQRIESVILQAFSDMPDMYAPEFDTPRADRVYELRSYESATEADYRNKVDMFNAGGEVALFDKLEFNAVFYGEVLSGAQMPNLMYMTTFADQASRDAHWQAFREAPEWLELKARPEYQNNVSHSDIYFLYPTEYSDY